MSQAQQTTRLGNPTRNYPEKTEKEVHPTTLSPCDQLFWRMHLVPVIENERAFAESAPQDRWGFIHPATRNTESEG